jgi:hypothetical protein
VTAIGKISPSEYALDLRLSRFTWMPRYSKKESREVETEDIQVGKVLTRITRNKRGRYRYRFDDWVVTSTREHGIFRAIPKKAFDKAVKEAEDVEWIGGAIRAFHVLTGHPPARIILMWFADTKHAEYFTTDYAPPGALPF